MKLDYACGGAGSRLLVLLHGLGTARDVWQPMLAAVEANWNGSWIAPDLRGHGRSSHAQSYALGLHAADVAELVRANGEWSDIVLLGHSMGGAIALTLASGWFGIVPSSIFGLGIKVVWSDEELAQLAKMSTAPVRFFESRQAAIERYLKVSGLNGLVPVDSYVAAAGVVKAEQGWRLSADPATASVGPPPMNVMLAAGKTPVHLARGETDFMVTLEQLHLFDFNATDLPGGHNAMVEHPEAAWRWLKARLA